MRWSTGRERREKREERREKRREGERRDKKKVYSCRLSLPLRLSLSSLPLSLSFLSLPLSLPPLHTFRHGLAHVRRHGFHPQGEKAAAAGKEGRRHGAPSSDCLYRARFFLSFLLRRCMAVKADTRCASGGFYAAFCVQCGGLAGGKSSEGRREEERRKRASWQ